MESYNCPLDMVAAFLAVTMPWRAHGLVPLLGYSVGIAPTYLLDVSKRYIGTIFLGTPQRKVSTGRTCLCRRNLIKCDQRLTLQ